MVDLQSVVSALIAGISFGFVAILLLNGQAMAWIRDNLGPNWFHGDSFGDALLIGKMMGAFFAVVAAALVIYSVVKVIRP